MLPTVLLVTAFCVLALLERRLPLRRSTRPRLARWGTNLVLAASGLACSALLVGPAMAGAGRLGGGLGILARVELPGWLGWSLALLLLDLTFYYWHRALHVLPLGWRFHAVHHADPDLDVSTSYRFHFGEVAASSVFRAAQVLCIGPSPAQLGAYALAYQLAVMLHHSNVRWPARVDRVLSLVLVTPRMHGVHHSRRAEHTGSNYGVVLSLWDRLHATRAFSADPENVCIGVPAFAHPRDNRPARALGQPFRQQPEYFRSPADVPEPLPEQTATREGSSAPATSDNSLPPPGK